MIKKTIGKKRTGSKCPRVFAESVSFGCPFQVGLFNVPNRRPYMPQSSISIAPGTTSPLLKLLVIVKLVSFRDINLKKVHGMKVPGV